MNPHDVVAAASRVRSDLERLRRRETMVVMFVDLVGSTEFKVLHPNEEEWLARLARFLIGVTHIVQEHGRVVKYIGDEVMAVFEDSSCVLHAEHAAENILDFCDQLSEDNVQVKIALDFGEVSLFDFGYSPTLTPGADPESRNTLDPQGVVVDRCARLMSKASAGAVLCSAALRESSRAPERWKPVGAFRPRGIPTPVEVFLLDTRGAPDLVIRDEGMTLNECTQELARTREMLELARRLNRR